MQLILLNSFAHQVCAPSFTPIVTLLTSEPIVTRFIEPETRLGSELGVIELKHHKWLRDFDFDGLYRSQLTSPIKVISIYISGLIKSPSSRPTIFKGLHFRERSLSGPSTSEVPSESRKSIDSPNSSIGSVNPKIKFLFQPELKGKIDTSQFENFSCATIDDSPPDETSGWDNEF